MKFGLSFIFPSLLFTSYDGKPWYNDFWYRHGLLGGYPHSSYQTSNVVAPSVRNLGWSPQCDHDYILLTPRGTSVPKRGLVVLDAAGELVWANHSYGEVMDLMVQNYQGQDYLTFWSGIDDGTLGRGSYYMLDSSYQTAHQVKAAGNLQGDLHEFRITPNDTALITVYEPIQSDLSDVGGGPNGWIYDGVFQEVDIATGQLLFQWRSSDFYPVEESQHPLGSAGKTKDDPYDYFHINSVDKDSDGNYYISSRYMHTVTSINPRGEVRWILGGARNDFTDLSDGAATNFSWQHHASWHSDGTITLFDNGASTDFVTAERSRGMSIEVDTDNMTATLLTSFESPDRFLAVSQGSVQQLANGNVFVGWGHSPAYTEFDNDGRVLCHTLFGSPAFFGWGWAKSYRAFKSPWVGHPSTWPSITTSASSFSNNLDVYVSWNGATEVKKWRVEYAADEEIQSDQDDTAEETDSSSFSPMRTVEKSGFETLIRISSADLKDWDFVRVAALDAKDGLLGYTNIIDLETGQVVSETGEPLEDSDEKGTSLAVWLVQAVLIMVLFLATWIFWRTRLRSVALRAIRGCLRVIPRGRSLYTVVNTEDWEELSLVDKSIYSS